jgi:hypothetical protein
LRNTIATSVLLTVGFLVGARYGINGVALAWCLIYPVLFGALLIASLRSAGFSLGQYAANLAPPCAASALMGVAVALFAGFGPADMRLRLFGSVGIGLATYALGVWIFDRSLVQEGIGLARSALAKRREP